MGCETTIDSHIEVIEQRNTNQDDGENPSLEERE
jgi:hypothetical protein